MKSLPGQQIALIHHKKSPHTPQISLRIDRLIKCDLSVGTFTIRSWRKLNLQIIAEPSLWVTKGSLALFLYCKENYSASPECPVSVSIYRTHPRKIEGSVCWTCDKVRVYICANYTINVSLVTNPYKCGRRWMKPASQKETIQTWSFHGIRHENGQSIGLRCFAAPHSRLVSDSEMYSLRQWRQHYNKLRRRGSTNKSWKLQTSSKKEMNCLDSILAMCGGPGCCLDWVVLTTINKAA